MSVRERNVDDWSCILTSRQQQDFEKIFIHHISYISICAAGENFGDLLSLGCFGTVLAKGCHVLNLQLPRTESLTQVTLDVGAPCLVLRSTLPKQQHTM